MLSEIHPLHSFSTYRYVVILSESDGQLLLSRHRHRRTWETQGGHIEPGESPMDAARRELYEESGATEYTLTALFDYRVVNERGDDTGIIYYASIRARSALPDSEMAEVRLFDRLPDAITYPAITPQLLAAVQQLGYFPQLKHDNFS